MQSSTINKISYAVVSFFIAAPFVHAEFEVLDQGQVIEQLSQYFGDQKFEDFKCDGKKIKFKGDVQSSNYSACKPVQGGFSCSTTNQNYPSTADSLFGLVLEECDQNGFSIFSTRDFAASVSKAEFDESKSILVPVLRGMGTFLKPEGKFKLMSLDFESREWLETGIVSPVNLIVVKLMYDPGNLDYGPTFKIGFRNDRKGLESLVYFSDDPIFASDAEYFFRRIELKK